MASKKSAERTDTFREKIGDADIQISDYKVDELRKIASSFAISGSHSMNKEELVDTINKTRKSQPSN